MNSFTPIGINKINLDPNKYLNYAQRIQSLRTAINAQPQIDESAYNFIKLLNPSMFTDMANRLEKPLALKERGSFEKLLLQYNALKDNLRFFYKQNFDTVPAGKGWEDYLKQLLSYYERALGG